MKFLKINWGLKWKFLPWPRRKAKVKGAFVLKTKKQHFLIARKILSQILQDWALLLMSMLTSGLWMITAAGVGMLVYLGTDALLGLFVSEELVRIGIGSVVAGVTLYWGRLEFFRVWGQDDSMPPEQQDVETGRRG